MSARRLFLDTCPGEVRGVVTVGGRPERLLVERDGVEHGPRLAARYTARITEIAQDLRLAYLDLGDGGQGVMAFKPSAAPARGETLSAEVVAEPRADKAAVLRRLGPAAGKPGPTSPAPNLEARLRAVAPGVEMLAGADAREAADEAEEAVLATLHDLGGGLSLSIEPTRALTAVDVDRAGAGPGSAKALLDANLRAVAETARLIRLKGLGGSIVIDLIGFPRESDALLAAAREAFAPDQPGLTVLPVSRLGLLQVARPHRERPLSEVLCGPDGRLSARSVAQRITRALAREGAANPGSRLTAACAPETAAALRPLVAALGPRYQVVEALGWDRWTSDIRFQ